MNNPILNKYYIEKCFFIQLQLRFSNLERMTKLQHIL